MATSQSNRSSRSSSGNGTKASKSSSSSSPKSNKAQDLSKRVLNDFSEGRISQDEAVRRSLIIQSGGSEQDVYPSEFDENGKPHKARNN